MHGEAEARGDIDGMNRQSKRTTRVTRYPLVHKLREVPLLLRDVPLSSFVSANSALYPTPCLFRSALNATFQARGTNPSTFE